jgi:hypothetical protein
MWNELLATVETRIRAPENGILEPLKPDEIGLLFGKYLVSEKLFNVVFYQSPTSIDGMDRFIEIIEDHNLDLSTQYPVVKVTSTDVNWFITQLNRFCEELGIHGGYRLPTYAEMRMFYQQYPPETATDTNCNRTPYISAINGRTPNQLGVYDTLGNVSEWTSTDSTWTSSKSKLFIPKPRHSPREFSSFLSPHYLPLTRPRNYEDDQLGFRIVRDPPCYSDQCASTLDYLFSV